MRRSRELLAFLALALCALGFAAAGASAEPPQVTTPQVLDVSYMTVEVGGEIDAGGEPTQYWFEVSPDGGVNWEPKGPYNIVEGSTLEQIPPATLEELSPGKTYQVRLAAFHLFTELEPAYSAAPNPEFTTLTVAAPGATVSAPNPVTGTTARMRGSITPGTPAGDPVAYDVEWHFECTPECPGNLGGTIPADSTTAEVEVEATTEGLVAGTDYEVTLTATNRGGTTTDGPLQFSTPTIAPVIAFLDAYPSISEALLEASINPGGLATTYHFEYGATDSYGSTTPVTSPSVGGKPVRTSTSITGLSPEATYHYRLIATNPLGTTTSGDRTFTTQPAASPPGSCNNEALRGENSSERLPDCRAYEKVSPAEKSDQGIDHAPTGSSLSGGTISYSGLGALGGSEATGITNTQVVGTRSDEGWIVHPLFLPTPPPAESGQLPTAEKISDDATEVAILGSSPSLGSSQAGVANLYLRNGLTGAARAVTNGAPANLTGAWSPQFGGASSDFNHLTFTAFGTLTPDAPGTVDNVYRWDDGHLQLASILPSGLPSEEGAVVAPDASEPSRRAMSSDGSRLFFTAGPLVESGTFPAPIYLREGNLTTQISASQRTPSLGEEGGIFWTATPDGSKAFFTSADQLTDDSDALAPQSDLYRYDVGTGKLTDLTPAPGGAGVAGVVEDASGDGSYLYFVATAQLDGSHGTLGGNNLYLWQEGHPVRFIATLGLAPYEAQLWAAKTRIQSGRVMTPDGRHLVFASAEPLTDYPNRGFAEVYSYDADSAKLACISCNPSGAPAEGDSLLAQNGHAGDAPQSRRVVVAAGTRIFFDSSDALVAGDSNGVQDVYEWEAEGAGSCRSARQNGGCIYLVSTGTSPDPSWFADASADGSDVFFTTTARLTTGDEDSLSDLYDARIDGGFPAAPQVQPCDGEACRGQGTSKRSAPAPGSLSFHQAPAPSLRVPKARLVRGREAPVKVTVSEPGELSWSGKGIASQARRLKRGGSATIRVSLTAAAARRLRAAGVFRARLRLSFAGAAGRGSAASVALAFTLPVHKPVSKNSKRIG